MQGGQWQVLYLARGLRERGHEQALFVQGELADRARIEGFDVRISGPMASSDLVHAHDSRGHTLAVLRARVPVVVSRRVGFPPGDGFLSRLKYGRAAHYIAVSRYVAGTLHDAGVKPERVTVVYDGVPIPAFEEPGLDEPVVGIMKDPLSPLLMEAARAAGVEVRPVADLVTDLGHARALAYVSAMQGLGSAAILAMSRGVPVIASRAAGGLPELVEDGRTGLLVENSIETIAAALTRIAGNREYARQLGVESYRRAVREFSSDVMVNRTVAVYQRMIA